MKYKGFDRYLIERDVQDIEQTAQLDGETQVDPDKTDRTSDLINSLKEIIQLAQKAISDRERGLGDEQLGRNPPEDEEDEGKNKLIGKPNADTAMGMFGEE